VFVAEASGDLALVLEELAPYVRARPAADWDVAELDRVKRAVTRVQTPTARLIAVAREATPAGTLATGDLPALTAWQAVAPRETLSPIGATPGYAVLAALALQLAHPDRRVVAFTAASGLGAGVAVLGRAAALSLPLVVVALGSLNPGSASRMEDDGVQVHTCRGEAGFALQFSRAFLAGRPAMVAVEPEPLYSRGPHDV
jgi:thiamine pyrophosphate-dependent acetolactate synthase large subunit-like protein